MTTDSDTAAALPLLPSKTADPVPTRRPAPTRTRGEEPPPRDGHRGSRAALVWLRASLTGANLLAEPMPALLAVWAKHVASAKYYDGWVIRWPRYGWGLAHTWVVAPLLRLAEWGTDSPPKAGFVLGTLWLAGHLLGWWPWWPW